eukprot:15336019-Ditylum_brightwellii.AAC.1
MSSSNSTIAHQSRDSPALRNTILKQWDADAEEQTQSIITGTDFPANKENSPFIAHTQGKYAFGYPLETPNKRPLLDIKGFNLHVHHVRHLQKRDTKAIAISFGRDKSRANKAKLYKMNKQSIIEKAKHPHTKTWVFVSFQVDGMIKEAQIGLKDIISIITIPGTQKKCPSLAGSYL